MPAVAENLHLDVTWALQVFLDDEPAVAEGGQRLVAGGIERIGKSGLRGDEPHAAPAAARRRLDQHRIAQPGASAAKRSASCASP